MALYTSYYTRQLALRTAGTGNELQQEGEKTVQKTVARRTVDYVAPYITWFEVRWWATDRHVSILPFCFARLIKSSIVNYACFLAGCLAPTPLPQRRLTIRSPADVPALPPVAAGALQLLPPAAYVHQPATSFNIKFAGQAPSKVCVRAFHRSLKCLLASLPASAARSGAAHPSLPFPARPQTRSSINAATWTPDGRRCLTGTQASAGAALLRALPLLLLCTR